MGSHGCSRLRKTMIEGRWRGCFIVIFNKHRPTRFSAGMFHGMSLLLSWHPTIAYVTQKGVLKLMNLHGLIVYHTNNHLQVHQLEKFLRFIHTFRFFFPSKDQGAGSISIMFQEKFGSFWTVIAAIFLNEYKNNAMRIGGASEKMI